MESFGGIHWNLTADPSNLQQFRLAVFILFLDSFLLCQIRITSRHLAGSLKAIARGLKEIHAFFVCRIDGCQFLVDLFDNSQVTQSQNLGIVRQMVTPNTLLSRVILANSSASSSVSYLGKVCPKPTEDMVVVPTISSRSRI